MAIALIFWLGGNGGARAGRGRKFADFNQFTELGNALRQIPQTQEPRQYLLHSPYNPIIYQDKFHRFFEKRGHIL